MAAVPSDMDKLPSELRRMISPKMLTAIQEYMVDATTMADFHSTDISRYPNPFQYIFYTLELLKSMFGIAECAEPFKQMRAHVAVRRREEEDAGWEQRHAERVKTFLARRERALEEVRALRKGEGTREETVQVQRKGERSEPKELHSENEQPASERGKDVLGWHWRLNALSSFARYLDALSFSPEEVGESAEMSESD